MNFSKPILFVMAVGFFLTLASIGPGVLAGGSKAPSLENNLAASSKTMSKEIRRVAETGFCCLKGNVFAATEKECRDKGGSYGKDEAQVSKQCASRVGRTRTAEKRPPETQVVNNSGAAIFQVKVDDKVFSEHLSSCSDGCSTGFQPVGQGGNPVYVKASALSPWSLVGSLGVFEYNKHYSVNMVNRGGSLCAELFYLDNTSIPFNDNRTKRKVASVCSRPFAPVPVE